MELLQQRLRECEHKMEHATTSLHYHQQQRRDEGAQHRRGEGKEGDESGLETRLKEGVSDEALERLQLAELSGEHLGTDSFRLVTDDRTRLSNVLWAA